MPIWPGRDRTGTPVDLVVIGLGNPGAEFEGTRHNVGADTVELLASRAGARLRAERGLHARAATVQLGDGRVLLAVPTTFMNESGAAAAPLVRRGGSAPLVVVHDELDLPVGRLKIKVGGGNAGHNGLRSIDRALRTREFARVRIGIGKPPGRLNGADYVLARPGARERDLLAVTIEQAADAVEVLCTEGVDAAMQRFNTAPPA